MARPMLDVRTDGPVFEVSGSLDADGAARFLEAVRRTDGDVRVDGSRLQRLDGAGLTALVVARRVCRERGRELVVISVPPEALRRLRARREILGLFSPTVDPTATEHTDESVDASPPTARPPTGPWSALTRGLLRRPRSHRPAPQEDDDG
jgi:ABC-type transporter Mla MlaB component